MESSVADGDSKEDAASNLRLQFEEYAAATISSRALAEKCRDYRDGKQWTGEEVKILKKRKQPVITDNKIQDKCDALLGIERQTRTDPKAYPRNPDNEDSADVATDALRYVADKSIFVDTVKDACDNLMVEGLCAGEVIVEKDGGKYAKIAMNHIRWDRVFYDIRSLRNDFKDKRYAGFFTWMDYDQAKQDWPGKEDVLNQCISGASEADNQTHDDKPRYVLTVRGRKRVRVFTHYYIESGQWMRAVWVYGGFLEEPAVSNYKDEDGKADCCIELQALYRDRDGNPYGNVQRYLDLQDEINKRRSKLLHLLNSKQIIMDKGAAGEEISKVRQQIHLPDGVIEKVPGMELEIHTNLDLAQGQFQLLQETMVAMSQTGPNASLIGNSGSVSGRAKQIDQQAGMLPVGPLFDALRSWKLRMYRHAWNRVKQYWRAPMWIRITDNPDTPKFVGLNQPLTQGEVAAKQLKDHPMPPEQKAQQLQQIAQDPAAQQPAIDEQGQPQLDNHVAKMDVDIIIDESPDTVTVQQEQFEILADLAKVRPDIPTSMLIEASSLQNKKQILEQLTGANDPNKQAITQLQQKMAELEAQLKQAQVAKTVAETEKIQQDTVSEHVDAAIKVVHAAEPVKITETVN